MLRAHLNRGTVHLLTDEDYLDFRPLFHQHLPEVSARVAGPRAAPRDLG